MKLVATLLLAAGMSASVLAADTPPTQYWTAATVRAIHDQGKIQCVVLETPEGFLFTACFKQDGIPLPLWIGLRAQLYYESTQWPDTYRLRGVTR